MHLTTLFQLTALAALLDPILAQTWTMSAYNTDTCADTSIFFTDSEDSTGSEGFGCHTFGSLAQAVQWNGDGFWCAYLYDTTDCSDQPSNFVADGASGCQSGSYGGFTLLIPDHGFSCNDAGSQL